MRYTSFVPAVLVLAILLVLGFVLFGVSESSTGGGAEPLVNFGTYARGLFSSGLFSAGVFSVGVFSIGVFSIGLFSIGIFSIGVFSLGLWVLGFFALGIYRRRQATEPRSEASV